MLDPVGIKLVVPSEVAERENKTSVEIIIHITLRIKTLLIEKHNFLMSQKPAIGGWRGKRWVGFILVVQRVGSHNMQILALNVKEFCGYK